MQKTNSRNSFIDILKCICILMIIITHYPWTDSERLKFLFPYWIDMAVPMFMVISGYVNALSFESREVNSFEKAYTKKSILRKIIRYTIPFLVVFFIEMVAFVKNGMIDISAYSLFRCVLDFLRGGVGPGSYYFPVMLQFVFFFPIIYFVIKKYQTNGAVVCLALNAIYELLQKAWGVNEEFYRLTVFRYTFLIGVGCFVACNKQRTIRTKMLLLSTAIGIAFIFCVCYLGYVPKVITFWPGTSFVAGLYVAPIAYLLLLKLPNICFAPLELIGKASYNIFLIQMIWYALFFEKYGRYTNNRIIDQTLSIIICLVLGVMFYLVESPITRRIDERVSTRC